MPGLYKRKRPTINSSYLHDASVWHSTPVDTTDAGDGSSTSAADENSREETVISPLKRPALGRGVNAPILSSTTTDAAASSSTSSSKNINDICSNEEEIEKDEDSENSSSSAFIRNRQQNLHISERFGPVVINPPSGHTYFASVLHTNGFILALPKNHLRVDIMSFRENMEKWLNENSNENSRIEDEATKFLAAMKKYFGVKENLCHSCTTTLNDRECIQPSLLHCLLGVKFIQIPLLQVALPALSEASFGHMQEDVDLVDTIINQMKWLPTLVNGQSFAEKLLDILENASSAAQKHIIRLFPEIFLPEYHPQLVPRLMTLFDLGTQVNVTMLDCFSSLVIPEVDCIRIRHSIVDQMASAPLQDIPAYLSFLFRVGSPVSQLEEGINEMREKIEIISKHKLPKDDAYMVEILERIRFFISVNPAIIKIWINKVKDDLVCEIELRTIDLLMILVFLESGDKSSIQTLSLMFGVSKLVNKLFDNMLQHNRQILQGLFPTLARYIDSILRTKNSKCHDAAGDIAKKLFVGLGPVLSQHLMTNLIGVLINGHPSCRDVILKIFTNIAETDARKLLFFHSYIMGALVYVIKFPPRQMQALMNILAIMAYIPEGIQGEENAFTLEFMILLRKQITHTNLRTRCFGVLGTIAAVRQLAIHPPVDEEKIDELLALAWNSIEKDEEACSIFFDELVKCVDLLPKDVCIRFRKEITNNFEKLWTLDQFSSDSQLLRSGQGQADLQLIPTFDANKEMQRDQLIIVLEPQALQMSPLVVPSHFRVMAELENVVEDGALEGIDAVLGCPILFPKIETYYEQESLNHFSFNQRLHLGQYLVLGINYFRECVSAFVGSDNAELRVKVWFRLSSIITLQKILVKHFDSFPNLPAAYGAEKSMSTNSTGAGFSGGFGNANVAKKPVGTSKKKPKPQKKKSKKNTNADDEDEDEEMQEEDDDEAQNQPVIKNPVLNFEEEIQPKLVVSHLRHLDTKVFNLVKYPLKIDESPVDHTGILLNLSTATQSEQIMQQVEKFDPESLAFLLTQIKQQTMNKMWKFNLFSVNELLISLCSHIDVIADFYQGSNSEGEVPIHQPKIDSCLHLLINTMDLYFEAIAHTADSNLRAKLTEKSILTLASRYRSFSQDVDVDELPTQVEMLANVAKYLTNFTNFVGTKDPLVAQDHVKLMKTIHDLLSRQEQIKQAIEDTVKIYLRRHWKLPSRVIDFFLKTWFSVTPTPMKVAEHLIRHLILEESEDEKDPIPNCSVYQSCSKINFHTWYAAIFTGFSQHVLKTGRRRGDFEDSIDFWKEAIELFQTLVLLSQQIKKSAILIPLLKNSRVYIEAFISGGVCLLPEHWKTDPKDAERFTKTLQNATRRIQNICEHSKLIKDNTLIKFVPQMKKVLETLLFRVREALANYGAAGAFWMGNLKIRNLDGESISSQPFNRSGSEEESSEEREQPDRDPFLSGAMHDDEEEEENVENEENLEDVDFGSEFSDE